MVFLLMPSSTGRAHLAVPVTALGAGAIFAHTQQLPSMRLCGGTERVVSFLTEELVRQGHDVTLFVRCCEMALRFDPSVRDALPYHMMSAGRVKDGVRCGRLDSASLYRRSTIHPQYSAAAAPGFQCERTFSKWHSLWRCPMLLNPRHRVRA